MWLQTPVCDPAPVPGGTWGPQQRARPSCFPRAPCPHLVTAPGLSSDVADTLVGGVGGGRPPICTPAPGLGVPGPRLLLWMTELPVSAWCPVVPGARSPAHHASFRLTTGSPCLTSAQPVRLSGFTPAPSPAPARAWPGSPTHAGWCGPSSLCLLAPRCAPWGRIVKPDQMW